MYQRFAMCLIALAGDAKDEGDDDANELIGHREEDRGAATITNTMIVVITVSRRVGQVTLSASTRTSCKNLNGLNLAMMTSGVDFKQGRAAQPLRMGSASDPVLGIRSPRKSVAGPQAMAGSYSGPTAASSRRRVCKPNQALVANFRRPVRGPSTEKSAEAGIEERYFDLSSGISPRLFSLGTQAALPSAMAFMQSLCLRK